MFAQETPPSILPPMFPSSRRRYVRVPPEYVYEHVIHLLREDLGLKDAEIKHLDNLALEMNLSGKIGVNVAVHIASEGDISVLNVTFGYRKISVLAASLVSAMIILSILFRTLIPVLGIVILFPIAYRVNLEVIRFLDSLNGTLPFLEQEYNRQILMKDREKLRRHIADAQALYEKLRKRHIEAWGNTNVLRYKIEEYQSMGLTYEEAIIRIAKEEGVITD